MSWDYSSAIGAATGVVGGLIGGALFGGRAGIPTASPLVGLGQNEFSQYQENIYPLQQQAIQRTLGPQAAQQAISQADQTVEQQFARAPGEFARVNAGLGVRPNAAQQAAFDKSMALKKGLYTAGAENAARQGLKTQQSMLTGV